MAEPLMEFQMGGNIIRKTNEHMDRLDGKNSDLDIPNNLTIFLNFCMSPLLDNFFPGLQPRETFFEFTIEPTKCLSERENG